MSQAEHLELRICSIPPAENYKVKLQAALLRVAQGSNVRAQGRGVCWRLLAASHPVHIVTYTCACRGGPAVGAYQCEHSRG